MWNIIVFCFLSCCNVSFIYFFTDACTGEYVLKVMWSGVVLLKCPLVGSVTRQVIQVTNSTNHDPAPVPVQPTGGHGSTSQQQRTTNTTHTTSKSTLQQQQQSMAKVIMTGVGIKQAYVNQLSEFQIDGASAGPGVQLSRDSGFFRIFS